MKQEVASFLDYVAHSPTVFQATQQTCDMLDAAGFTRLSEHEAWEILPGGRYYVTRNRSALVAFAVPENGFTHCQIVASHGDSPTFKLKAHAEGEAAGAYIRLDVEPYGGMIMSTWFDRPLSIAGRALVREDGRLVTRLIDLDRDAALIPNMPIHFNRDINSGYSYNPQTDMLPLLRRQGREGALAAEIAAKAGAKEEDVVACDLVPLQPHPRRASGGATRNSSPGPAHRRSGVRVYLPRRVHRRPGGRPCERLRGV